MVPTVFLVGCDRLPLVPEFLNLGSVVVIAPDLSTLDLWRGEQHPAPSQDEPARSDGTVIDFDGRRVTYRGAALPLSDLEFRVLTALLTKPGRALSFAQLRRIGWGDTSEMVFDVYSVRALIQRLRAKIATVGAPVSIESVRGFGFRIGAEQACSADERASDTIPAASARNGRPRVLHSADDEPPSRARGTAS